MLTVSNEGIWLDLGEVAGACSCHMPTQGALLDLERCPHCNISKPNLGAEAQFRTKSHSGDNSRWWVVYSCRNCGGAVLTGSFQPQAAFGASVIEQYPTGLGVAEEIPERAKTFLIQSQRSLHAPVGAIILAASAVDAMLKAKGLTEGSLFVRIDKAAETHLITE